MSKRFKRAGILVLTISAVMMIEGLAIEESLAIAQNANSSVTIRNSNSKPGVKRKKTSSRRRGRRGRRGSV